MKCGDSSLHATCSVHVDLHQPVLMSSAVWRRLPGTSQPLVTTLISKPEWQVVVRRIQDMYNALLLLLYTAVPYNLLISVVKLLGAGVFLTWLEPPLQRFLAIFIGELLHASQNRLSGCAEGLRIAVAGDRDPAARKGV